ncbi:MAG: transposase [Deltaproteobacteria bacterium CG23_combo_of_CG06-09_8_20_14_all_51_20]|nr:IS21 family transposase [Deltaproteobacteria bacterium]PIP47243.1 MAG: transposase [Deltaproteobacteria bacterium CG23_combo_of_CG06-09_8_20_14_all_51_20]PIY43515.1 MAG: transposase [Armatimonadetes bacterium CG_4_10_14_3_um_filter_59_10]
MIDYEIFARIKHLHEQKGLAPTQIARELSLDPRTVARWLAEKRFLSRAAGIRPSKLDPFKDSILRMLESHPYTARQVLQRIQEEGFGGRYSIVKRYVHKVRPTRKPAYLTLAFAPGECAQVDWGSYGSIRVGESSRRLSFFVMVLCYSRQMYVEFTVSQTMEHFLAAHANAFAAFGGVPTRIMVDNLKSAVLQHTRGQVPVLNPRYLDFARHHGFTITACGVRKANEKGRVENAVGYVKKNFLAGSDLPDFTALAPAAKLWLDTVANVRIHGETRKQPVKMLMEERPHLLPLPANPYDIATVVQVRASSQFRVAMDSNRYSVPARYAGYRLTMKIYPDRLCLYHEAGLIARHVRSYERNRDFEDPDHPKELIAKRKKADDQKRFFRFLALSPRAIDYFRELDSRHLNAGHHVRKILALADIHGADAVALAMDDALKLHAAGADYIANILQCRARKLPEPGPLHLTRRADLLDITIQGPDLSIYDLNPSTTKEPAP